MLTIYGGDSNLSKGALQKLEVDDFKSFCIQFLSKCEKSEKGGSFFISASEVHELHRNKKNIKKSWCVVIDGDKSKGMDTCVPLKKVHRILKLKNINHVIHSSYSHNPPDKIKWRLIVPCVTQNAEDYEAAVRQLYSELAIPELDLSGESRDSAHFWFLPRSKDPRNYEVHVLFDGNDFQFDSGYKLPERHSIKSTRQKEAEEPNDVTGMRIDDMIKTIVNGDTPLHETIGHYIYGQVLDGQPPATIKAVLHGLTSTWDSSDKRLNARRLDIDRRVDAAYKKFVDDQSFEDWDEETKGVNYDRLYTEYKTQGGVMEEFIQYCMDYMMFPNRQLAVVSCHAVISALGGRVYSLDSGSGICFSALCMGRSTIGKNIITKFFVHVIRQLKHDIHEDPDFLGSIFHTSPKNYVKEISKYGSALFVRTESGHSDRSKAGDMHRLMMYELSLATASGRDGYVASGGQNEKIPELYSPAVTTIRESVEEIQSEADLLNRVDISGASGRRSHVLIDPLKVFNEKLTDYQRSKMKLPKHLKERLVNIYNKGKNPTRFDLTKPLRDDLWIGVKYQDYNEVVKIRKYWLQKDNDFGFGANKNSFLSTFYGRMFEKVPAWAARLAIIENPDKPLITTEQVRIASDSLESEALTFNKRAENDPWDILINDVVKLFKGDMTRHKTFISTSSFKIRDRDLDLLRKGIVRSGMLRNRLNGMESFKQLKGLNYFDKVFKDKLEHVGIFHMSQSDAKRKHNVNGILVYRA